MNTRAIIPVIGLLSARLLAPSVVIRLICCVLILVPSVAQVVIADEITWQNDSLVEGGDAYIQAGFREGDIGAAVFDLPCGFFPIQINAVQVYWKTQGSSAQQLVTHMYVYGDGSPDPGPPIYTGDGALMTEGYMLEFPTVGRGWTISEGPFTVGIEYIGQLSGSIGDSSGHLITDADGCQPGKNLIYDAVTSQWFDACSAGVSGDFVIRLIFESSGNGCFGDADCDGDVDLLDYAEFQRCLSGEGTPAAQECLPLDCDADSDVDFDDFQSFESCVSGPEMSCDPACIPCQLSPGAVPPPGGPRWNLRQVLVVVSIISVISVLFIGPCISATCRFAAGVSFINQGQPLNSLEQLRIGQAMSWLQTCAAWDVDCLNAYTWYETHGGTDPTFGPFRVNHLPRDPEQGGPNIVASVATGTAKVVIHQDFVTGSEFSPDLLALILFAEWQHVDAPQASEQSLQPDLDAFRQRHGITAHPEFQHGFHEGGGIGE